MTDSEVLSMTGVVVRKMPKVSVSRLRLYTSLHGGPKETETRKLVEGPDESGLYVLEERKPVSAELAGKYLVTFVHGTGSSVRFVKGRYGVGDSIAEAYRNIRGRVVVDDL